MLEWLFNISIISLLIILIFHYAFDFFAPNKSMEHLVDLKVQKYKNIIDAMVKEQNVKKEEVVEDDSLEELEEYIRELVVSA
jgi:hypothetical protein